MFAADQVFDAVKGVTLGVSARGGTRAQIDVDGQHRAFVAGGVAARAAEQSVSALAAHQHVVALTAVQRVVARVAVNFVVADQAADVVVTGTRVNFIAQTKGREHDAFFARGVGVGHVGRAVHVAHDGRYHQLAVDGFAAHLTHHVDGEVEGAG